MEEREAIQRLKQKDPGGLQWLVEHYYERALQAAYLITADRASAEDVVQQKFADLFRSVGQFDEKRPFAPWFMRSVINQAVQLAQKSNRFVPIDDAFEDDPFASLVLEEASAEDTLISMEFKTRVWQAMNQLSPRQKAVVVERYFLEMNEREMGQALEIAPGTVKWLLNAARKKLRVLLEGERSNQ